MGVALPVDLWTMHAFILPENYVWGASIPPGMADFADEGMQYTVDDHDDLAIFQANIVAFRTWMAAWLSRQAVVGHRVWHPFVGSPRLPYDKVRTFMVGSFDLFSKRHRRPDRLCRRRQPAGSGLVVVQSELPAL
ncbi:MAG: hypothetical protein R2867_16825 [Caldilineaceae bacterium]